MERCKATTSHGFILKSYWQSMIVFPSVGNSAAISGPDKHVNICPDSLNKVHALIQFNAPRAMTVKFSD